MKNLKPALVTFGFGLAAAYAFAVASVKFGPFPGIGVKASVLK